jgi:hypothetical protein
MCPKLLGAPRTGFVISEDEKRIFIVNRETNPQNGVSSERVLEYKVTTGTKNAHFFDNLDFISKSAHLINNELVVVGGSYINVYNLSFDLAPDTASHALALTRFGSATYNGALFIWGGDLNMIESDLIREWSFQENVFTTIAQMPTPKTWADGEVVDNKLYIFGGQPEFQDTPPSDIVYILDLDNLTFRTITIQFAFSRTFTAAFGSRILIAGHLGNDENIISKIGVFDTVDDSFTELTFSALGKKGNIHQMYIAGNNLYILFGDEGDVDPLTLMKSSLSTF